MKTCLFLVLSVFITPVYSYAQLIYIERQVIGACGDLLTASWGNLSYTCGETMTLPFNVTGIELTQGFQQRLDTALVTMVSDATPDFPIVEAYPNPASNTINVSINSGNMYKKFSATLFDLLGQKLSVPCKTTVCGPSIIYVFQLECLAAASYLIRVDDDAGKTADVVKFTKTN